MNNYTLLKKFMIYIVLLSILLVGIALSIKYYVEIEPDFPPELCWKGKYLVQIDDGGSVYTKAKGVTCEIDKHIMILEFTND